jgi:hypothetical protein
MLASLQKSKDDMPTKESYFPPIPPAWSSPTPKALSEPFQVDAEA